MKPTNKMPVIVLLMGLVLLSTTMDESNALSTSHKDIHIYKSLLLIRSLYQFEETDSIIDDSGEQTKSDSVNKAISDESLIPEASEEITEDKVDMPSSDRDSDSLDIISQSSEAQTGKAARFPFYRRWWFSFLLVLPVFLIMRRSYLKKEGEFLNTIEKQKEEIETVKEQLVDTETHFDKTQKEQAERLEAEKELRYNAEGISKFSDLLSRNKSNTSVLGQKIISELVSFVGANSGAMYLLKEENNGNEPLLEFLGGFAPDLSQIKSSFKEGEGYVGSCFKEGKTMELSNTEESFMKVYSGLGEASPSHIVFVPLKQDEFKIGVIEIASFRKLDEYKIRFIENLSENIASTIALNQANDKMQAMLEQSKIQSKELQTREEELKQNLEEMHATQDDLNRQMEKNKKMQESLMKEKALLDSLLNSLPDYIYFKDLNSKFIRISKSMLPLFPVKDVDEMIGKSDFDFQDKETAQKYYEEEKNIIKTGKGFVDKVIHEVMENGYEQWSSTSKMPLYDETGNCIGTFGITKNITELKKLEMDAKERAEQLLSQEEELKQNLEEMQTVQEDLQKQKEELSKEKSLMDALLSNAKESIYFKDEKSRFIKVSNSMAKMFKVKSVEKLYGKTDFDFFTEEHARPAFNDEMNIIKTGKPILDKIEKETHPDGRVSWVTTSKMPLRNSAGKIIGTFGISKDITDLRKMEMAIKEKNEELLAQEEELRQNLEEMQTTQEELERQIQENKAIQEELEKEKYLMDALMENVPEYIYFKDLESKFIKNSKSHALLFGYPDPKKIYGKSDFDFFAEEHARPAYKDEQRIIKTGKPIINLVEKEVKKDGKVSWVSTSKMPLRNQKGKVVGTFGISKDITDIKNMEFEIKQKLDENEKIKKEFEKKENEFKKTIQKLKQEMKK
ncbi:MAG: PAS domain-containing protein [Bacteroidales bacterium]|nr:PAS domain-containing protein [Bacteroidales bacterium]